MEGTSNLQLTLNEKSELKLKASKLNKLKSNEVCVAIKYCGICATDLHFWKWGGIGDMKINKTEVIGHEASGTVVKIGSDVKTLKEGDRVAIETSNPCYMCDLCLEGKYHLCLLLERNGIPPTPGLFANYINHPENFCFKLPDSLSFEEGALVEPLSVGLWACRRGGIVPGDKVLICGAGAIGLSTLLSVKTAGATEVIITDIMKSKLEFAAKKGATHTLLVGNNDSPKDVAEKVRKMLGSSPDVSFDCFGMESTLQTAIYATKSGGVMMVVGLGKNEARLPIVDAALREVDIRGVNRYPNCYSRTISLIEKGMIEAKDLVTKKFDLENAIEAFEEANNPKSNNIKILIDCEKKK